MQIAVAFAFALHAFHQSNHVVDFHPLTIEKFGDRYNSDVTVTTAGLSHDLALLRSYPRSISRSIDLNNALSSPN